MSYYGHDEKRERNEEWVRLHIEEGMTLTEIGDEYGVTRERVRQVLRKYDVPQWVTMEIRSVAMRENALVDWECDVCGKQERRVAKYAQLRTCGDPECVSAVHRNYTDDELLDRLHDLAVRLGHTPRSSDLIERSPPAHTLYFKRFGSLRRAQELAGLPPNQVGGSGIPEPYEPRPVEEL